MKPSRAFLIAASVLALAAGLSLQRAAPTRADAREAPTPNYRQDIRPIVAAHCVSCHQEHSGAPFPLTTYRDVEKRAAQIAQVATAKFMPPWKPDSHGELLGENRLSTREIDLLQRWAAQNTLEGPASGAAPDVSAAIPLNQDSRAGLGTPDAVLEPAETSHIPADGPDFYRCCILPTRFAEDRHLSAIVLEPGSAAVDHALIYQDTSHQIRLMNAVAPGGAFRVQGSTTGLQPAMVIGGWGVGAHPARFPAGAGLLLSRGADIIVETHYRPSGKPETDRPRLLLYFCKAPVTHLVRVAPVMPRVLRLPPNVTDIHVGGQSPVTSNISVLSILPYMRRRGAAITMGVLTSEQKQSVLLSIPQWDFDWIGEYRFRQPVRILAGSMLTMEAIFNNAVPDSDRDETVTQNGLVCWGDAPTDENAVAYIFYTTDAESLGRRDIAGVPPAGGPAQAGMRKVILKMFDTNHDGTISPEEYRHMSGYFHGGMPSMAGMEM
ncbi:hypothetical protein CCAX7_003330 [Capsulimonas corticalis]|uniref:Uncharacterized protein n=1 Tax=Capsulimonas corticalis TaxID=2219043 RepID=A0A402CS73_9BACT|nr:EF-hand domain-containing protein [Capsulimonas corticalis]BDI28282.1 hypothetical protein CCAX7_003330 [Capsulimonas corticalis]